MIYTLSCWWPWFCLQAGRSSADVSWWFCFCLQAGRSSADVYWWPCFCLQAGRSSADVYWWLFLFAGWTKQCRCLLMTVFVCRMDEAVQRFNDDSVFVCRLDEAVQTFIDDCACLQAGRSSAGINWWLFLFAGWTKQCKCLLMTLNQTLSWTSGLTCEKFITAFENYGWGDKGV